MFFKGRVYYFKDQVKGIIQGYDTNFGLSWVESFMKSGPKKAKVN